MNGHLCDAPGCGRWGSFGRVEPRRPGEPRVYRWRCRAHLWPDFLPGNRAAAAVERKRPAQPAAQGRLL